MVRPQFAGVVAVVRDISAKGAGLLCDAPIEPGSALAVLWDYGPPHQWRTLRATVARLSPRRHGGWIIGCAAGGAALAAGGYPAMAIALSAFFAGAALLHTPSLDALIRPAREQATGPAPL